MRKMRTFWQKTGTFWRVLPAALLAAGVTAFVVLNAFREGLGYLPELSMYTVTGENYAALFCDRVFWKSLGYSFYVAAVSTLLCLCLGLLLGYLVCRGRGPLVHMLYRLPIVLSYVAAGLLLYTTLSDYGLLYHLLHWCGVPVDGLDILFRPSGVGVILLNCFKGVPFMAMSTAPVLRRALELYPAAAMNLGASRWRIACRIVLPLARRAALTAALVLFNYQMFAYEGFYYLGSSTPVSLGVLVYQSALNSDLRHRAVGMAIQSVMIVISLLTSLLYIRAMRREVVMP